jgi:hypothetical protein
MGRRIGQAVVAGIIAAVAFGTHAIDRIHLNGSDTPHTQLHGPVSASEPLSRLSTGDSTTTDRLAAMGSSDPTVADVICFVNDNYDPEDLPPQDEFVLTVANDVPASNAQQAAGDLYSDLQTIGADDLANIAGKFACSQR